MGFLFDICFCAHVTINQLFEMVDYLVLHHSNDNINHEILYKGRDQAVLPCQEYLQQCHLKG